MRTLSRVKQIQTNIWLFRTNYVIYFEGETTLLPLKNSRLFLVNGDFGNECNRGRLFMELDEKT